jgi:hypothetical protein
MRAHCTQDGFESAGLAVAARLTCTLAPSTISITLSFTLASSTDIRVMKRPSGPASDSRKRDTGTAGKEKLLFAVRADE